MDLTHIQTEEREGYARNSAQPSLGFFFKQQTMIDYLSRALKEALELGFNVSKVCEKCLKDAIRSMREPKTQTETNGWYTDAPSV